MSTGSIYSSSGAIAPTHIVVADPGKPGAPSNKAQQDLVFTLKQIESEQAQTAQWLDQAQAIQAQLAKVSATVREDMSRPHLGMLDLEALPTGL